jgi:hypothetical protein
MAGCSGYGSRVSQMDGRLSSFKTGNVAGAVDINSKDSNGQTLLSWAVETNLEVVVFEILLDIGKG